uniref:Aminotran_5 domain-containing protein n=1 Tax=Macrostomum lignano TaxID=282301 RepID=A0A1I8FD23_9PLAT
SEANDLAQRLALYYTKNRDGICLDHAYHGHVMSCIGISPYKFMHGGSEEKKPDHIHVNRLVEPQVPTPDRYRGKYRDDQMSMSELTDAYVGEVQSACDSVAAAGRGVSFFISESMQSCGGQVIFPPGYLRRVYDIVRRSGGVCIADEVQTGFGRVGSKWWAFQLDDDQLVPDIVTIGKPMGNGHPISAVITTPAIAEAFRRGPDYFNTYGGNPVSCAIALAVLDVIEQDKLRENAVRVGEHLKRAPTGDAAAAPHDGRRARSRMFLASTWCCAARTRQPAGQAAETVLW